MKLYEINEALEELLEKGYNAECIDEETGEIDEEKAKQLLDDLSLAFDDKVENIGCYVKSLTAEIAALKAESDNLKKRAEQKQKKVDSLKRYLASVLNGKGFESARVTVGFRKSVAVKVINEELIPDCYIDEKVIKKPNLAEIKASLKLGSAVKGCELEERLNINLK